MKIYMNPKIKTVRGYTPPIPVLRHFDDVDTNAPASEQIESLLWIPALLVSRYLGQFPCLTNEADELFSIGVLKVVEIVASNEYDGERIGTICYDRARMAMESYCKNLDSIVSVSRSTRWKNHKEGVETPRHFPLTVCSESSNSAIHDNHAELLVRDACEMLGYDPANLTLRQKRRLKELLIDQ